MKFPGKFKITRDDAMTVYYMANSRRMSLRMGTRTHILLSSARNTLSHEKVLLGEAHLDRNRHVQLFFLNKIQHPVNKSTKIIYQQVQKTSAYIPPPPSPPHTHTHPNPPPPPPPSPPSSSQSNIPPSYIPTPSSFLQLKVRRRCSRTAITFSFYSITYYYNSFIVKESFQLDMLPSSCKLPPFDPTPSHPTPPHPTPPHPTPSLIMDMLNAVRVKSVLADVSRLCSDEGLTFVTSPTNSLWRSADPHQPYVDTFYI